MKRTIVYSSTLRSAGYDADDCILELEFTSGDVYRYYNVPGGKYLGLMMATSKSSFFSGQIKDQHDFKKISSRLVPL
jgi:hypothetical protein